MTKTTAKRPVTVLKALLLCTSALAAVGFNPAYAQDASTDETANKDEVIVTSQRREQNILDVPYNISVVSGDDIEAGITWDNAELLRSIPGVSQVDQGPRSGAQFNSIRIRGLNVDSSALGDFAVASVSTVSTYLNETPVYANLALVDINRVEILRGPQGTLYGSGALGGTLKYFLNQPELGEYSGNAGAQVSSVKNSDSIGYALRGVVNIPMGETFAVRANIYWQDYPGITDYVNLYTLDANGVPNAPNGLFDRGFDSATYTSQKDADTYKNFYGRISAYWEPSQNFDITANYIHQDQDVGGRRQQTQGNNGAGTPFNELENGAVILEPSEQIFDMGSLEANIDLGFATLTSASSYYDNHGSSETDNTGFYANNFANFYYNLPRPLYTAERTFGDKAFIQEVRLVSNGNNTVDYIVGGFYRKQTLRSSQISDLVGFETFADALFPPFDFVSTDNVFTYRRINEYKDFALFGELTWNVTDQLHVTGGARYFDNKTDVDTFIRVGAYDSFAGSVSTPFSSTDNDVLFKANISYEFNDDDLVYATISEGFRRGGNNGVPTIGRFANDASWQVYQPDTVTNYEIGIKGTMSSVRYDLSAFVIDWKNPQFNTSAPVGSFFAVVNGDKAKTKGFELQISGPVGERGNYAFGYAFVDAELSEALLEPINILTGTRTQIAPKGAPLPGISQHALNFAYDYTMPISSSMDFTGRIDGFYQSKTQNVLDQSILQAQEFAGFSTWDATATVTKDKWSASLFVKNLFDIEGTTGAFTPGAFGPNPTAEFFGSNSRQFITLPRTVGAALNVRF